MVNSVGLFCYAEESGEGFIEQGSLQVIITVPQIVHRHMVHAGTFNRDTFGNNYYGIFYDDSDRNAGDNGSTVVGSLHASIIIMEHKRLKRRMCIQDQQFIVRWSPELVVSIILIVRGII